MLSREKALTCLALSVGMNVIGFIEVSLTALLFTARYVFPRAVAKPGVCFIKSRSARLTDNTMVGPTVRLWLPPVSGLESTGNAGALCTVRL